MTKAKTINFMVIRCKNCGAKRKVATNNYKEVKLCIPCYYAERRKYNSMYVKAWRAKKKLEKKVEQKHEKRLEQPRRGRPRKRKA